MKKNLFALAAAIVCIFTVVQMVACSKEQDNNAPVASMVNSQKEPVAISNSSNPYDYCGRIHNEILDYIIAEESQPSQIDIYTLAQEYLKNMYGMDSDISYAETSNGYNVMTDFITHVILEGVSFSQVYESDLIAEVMDTLASYANNMIHNNELLHPNVYANQIVGLEHRIMERRNDMSFSLDSIAEYDVTLAALSIARYSYAYWYDVANDIDNPWNYTINNTKSYNQDGDKPRNFWGKLWDKICNIVVGVTQTVVQVAVTPIVDVAGLVFGGMEIHDTSYFGISINVSDGIDQAGTWLAGVWGWNWNE